MPAIGSHWHRRGGVVRTLVVISVTLASLLSCATVATPGAEDPQAGPNDSAKRGLLSDDPDDPGNLLPTIRQRGAQKESVFRVSPLAGLHEVTDRAKDDLHEATGLELGLAITHLFQGLSESPLGDDTLGTVTDLDFLAAWELLDRGEPTQGELVFHVQGRWDYGTTGPEELGTGSLGSLVGTANTFAAYSPAFPIRNLYWEQGSEEAGWAQTAGDSSSSTNRS